MQKKNIMEDEGQGDGTCAASTGTALRPPARLLVIDDDMIHRMVLCAVAEQLNYISTAVGGVDEAVQLLRERQFDCITLDLSLDTRHGAELLPHIAQTGNDPLLVIISGAADAIRDETVRVAEMLKLKVVQLQKPVNMSALRDTLSQCGRSAEVSLVPPQS
jgi:CheY-like chemotaxis protein